MPRREEDDHRVSRRSRDDDDENDSDYSTDSDCEYQLSPEDATNLIKRSGVSQRAANDAYCKQRGICRITGIPFSDGMYKPVLVARKCSEPISDTNCMIVIEVMERLHSASNMNWRTFVRFLQIAGKEAEL